MTAAVSLDGISKRFAATQALDDVSIEVGAGEVRGLVGENGSGKSTLLRVLAGEIGPDDGRVRVYGEELAPRDTRGRRRAGVGVVAQHPEVCSNLTVAEHAFLGDPPARCGWLALGQAVRRTHTILAQENIVIPEKARVGALSHEQRHFVEVLATVARKARVIAFDETTASLTEDHVARLFDVIRRWRDIGSSVLFVTHRLEEVFRICDSVSVLRDGRHIATRAIADVDPDALVQMMVGRSYSGQYERPAARTGAVRLRLRGVRPSGRGTPIDLDVKGGEVVGLAGLVGSGRSAVLESVYGLRPRSGEVSCDGATVPALHPRAAMRLGLGLVPEDRRRQGLAMEQTIQANAALLDPAARGLFRLTSRRRRTSTVDAMRRDLALKAGDPRSPVRTLSGGNQQKLVLGRWLDRPRPVLLLDEPTRGIDVGAKREIYDLIHRLAQEGTAILLATSELPELLGLADRVVVLREGRIVGVFPRGVDEHTVGVAMTGVNTSATAEGDGITRTQEETE